MRRRADLGAWPGSSLRRTFSSFSHFGRSSRPPRRPRIYGGSHRARAPDWAGLRHAHDLVGDPVRLLLVGIIRLADVQFCVNHAAVKQTLYGEIAGELLRG